MKTKIVHQNLPAEWAMRERLRNKGQFWTPDWVAETMIAYVAKDTDTVFDPGVGKGAFFTALKKYNAKNKKAIRFYGIDIDPIIIAEANQKNIFDPKLCEIEIRDFVLNPPKRLFKGIVANPPYVRHHRLSQELKNHFQLLSFRTVGSKLDGRAGLHIYFLIQALTLLDNSGKLAFIMPADTCEGVFARKLWNWIVKNFCLECVITFSHQASPFPDADTNALIFMIKKGEKSCEKIWWVKCLEPYTDELKSFVESGFGSGNFSTLEIYKRDLVEALHTGLSRKPSQISDFEFKLSDFATVMRGIATGANEFFFLTKQKADLLKIPKEFLLPAIGRTRDVEGPYITQETLAKLEKNGRPTLLFAPDGRNIEDFSKSVRDYLKQGELLGLNKKALISTRQPWYKMEQRKIPPFLFSYLGRRNARFIKNDARVLPLTGFLCVYPYSNDGEYLKKLWSVLQHPETIKNLNLVGKSYGAGAIKVEPRALENLPLPTHLVEQLGLKPIRKGLLKLPI